MAVKKCRDAVKVPENFEKLREELGINVCGTTKDRSFTLEATRYLGRCGLTPVMMIDEDVYGRLTSDKIPEILREY